MRTSPTLLLSLLLSFASIVSAKLALDCDTVGGSNGSDITWLGSNSYFPPKDQTTGGWTALPSGPSQVCGADLTRLDVGDKGGTLPMYVSNDTVDDEVLRVIIIAPPLGREVWDYFTQIRNARQRAEAQFTGLQADHVAIIGPVYFTMADYNAGALEPQDYVWGGNSWMHGGHAAGPSTASPHHTSSFDAGDAVMDWIRGRYPKVERIVVTGHSAGAQQVNRYATMSKMDFGDDVHFWIANPSSYAWMESARPVQPAADCPQYDDWKYGLSGNMSTYTAREMTNNGKSGLLSRLGSRNVHLLVGDNDDGQGDVGCQAATQGPTHFTRGQNYVASIKGLNNGNLFDPWTFDQIPECSHDSNCMFQSYIGQQELFYNGYPGASEPWARKGSSSTSKSSSKSKTSSSATHKSTSASSNSKQKPTSSGSSSKSKSASSSSSSKSKPTSSSSSKTRRASYAREDSA